MPELLLLLFFMVGTLILLAGLMYIFRHWMDRREDLPFHGDVPTSRGGHGTHASDVH